MCVAIGAHFFIIIEKDAKNEILNEFEMCNGYGKFEKIAVVKSKKILNSLLLKLLEFFRMKSSTLIFNL